jgi:hypothetical protein
MLIYTICPTKFFMVRQVLFIAANVRIGAVIFSPVLQLSLLHIVGWQGIAPLPLKLHLLLLMRNQKIWTGIGGLGFS